MTTTLAPELTDSGEHQVHESSDRVIVIGAGPAGLTAAYLLAQQGREVTVLEADDTVGGISRTVEYNGYRFDIGGHRFFTKIKPVENLWHEILGEDFLEVPRTSRIVYNGTFFHYPLKAQNALAGLGLRQTALVIGSYVRARLRPHPVEENFEQWVSNRFGERLYRIFFKTYTEKVWGIPCTEIRAEWAAQRVQGLSLVRAIISAASLQKRPARIKSLIERFHYPRLGPGQMWEACAAKVQELGGKVLLGHRVTKLDCHEDSVVSATVATAEGEKKIPGKYFINTMPLRSLIRALDPAPSPAVVAGADNLRYRDFMLVALMLDKPELFPDNWIYVHTAGVKVGRIQNFRNWSKAMVPRDDVTCIGMEYFCFKGDDLWTKPDEELLALATDELTRLGLAPGARVIDGSVVRMPKAYPIYDATYASNVEKIREHLETVENLVTIGRNGMHKYNNQDHSMYTAMLAVENMNGASHDIWAVNTDYEYHEEQRIESPGASA
ncbi:MAG TPA: NAD(P)/FAD-dependent oxidoreductase [Gemmatimonadaceae bacterium]